MRETTELRSFSDAERPLVVERTRMAVAEAGYPGAIGTDGCLATLDAPPDVVYKAWAISTEQTNVTFAEFVAACMRNGGLWPRYFRRWAVEVGDPT